MQRENQTVKLFDGQHLQTRLNLETKIFWAAWAERGQRAAKSIHCSNVMPLDR
jgi:hypothetical protein